MSTKRALLAYREKNPSESKTSVFRLPFVGEFDDDQKEFRYWDVPLTGGYFGGEITGKALGVAYLRFVELSEADDRDDDTLSAIVMAMARKIAEHDAFKYKESETVAAASIRAQMQAFLAVIDKQLSDDPINAVTLEATTEKEIIDLANKGLSLDSNACHKFWDLRTEVTEQEKIFAAHYAWPVR